MAGSRASARMAVEARRDRLREAPAADPAFLAAAAPRGRRPGRPGWKGGAFGLAEDSRPPVSGVARKVVRGEVREALVESRTSRPSSASASPEAAPASRSPCRSPGGHGRWLSGRTGPRVRLRPARPLAARSGTRLVLPRRAGLLPDVRHAGPVRVGGVHRCPPRTFSAKAYANWRSRCRRRDAHPRPDRQHVQSAACSAPRSADIPFDRQVSRTRSLGTACAGRPAARPRDQRRQRPPERKPRATGPHCRPARSPVRRPITR